VELLLPPPAPLRCLCVVHGDKSAFTLIVLRKLLKSRHCIIVINNTLVATDTQWTAAWMEVLNRMSHRVSTILISVLWGFSLVFPGRNNVIRQATKLVVPYNRTTQNRAFSSKFRFKEFTTLVDVSSVCSCCKRAKTNCPWSTNTYVVHFEMASKWCQLKWKTAFLDQSKAVVFPNLTKYTVTECLVLRF